jgi:hypothetical protein
VMKFIVPLLLFLALVGVATSGFDAPLERAPALRKDLTFDAAASGSGSNGWARAIQDSADAAFASLESEPTRSETRVGPQPWPEDLRDAWPTLRQATVVADTKGGTGDRLLLINLPGDADQAMAFVETALRGHGYDVERPKLQRGRRALHAQSPDHEAVLTFFPRQDATRMEILILHHAAG